MFAKAILRPIMVVVVCLAIDIICTNPVVPGNHQILPRFRIPLCVSVVLVAYRAEIKAVFRLDRNSDN
jgi:hypothetical protein